MNKTMYILIQGQLNLNPGFKFGYCFFSGQIKKVTSILDDQ